MSGVNQSVRGSALLQRGYMRGLDEGECGTERGWMGRQSVQVSADVRLLNSGGTGEGQCWTSQGIAPESFTPLCYNLQQNTTTSDCGGSGGHGGDGECLRCGGPAPYPGERPITGLQPPVCGMQLR